LDFGIWSFLDLELALVGFPFDTGFLRWQCVASIWAALGVLKRFASRRPGKRLESYG
jgi:hypothetical protein